MSKEKNNLGFRGWFYFRQGWSNYLTFLMGGVNTLTVTYFLAIERYPTLEAIFPTFIHYILIVPSIGIPLLVLVGYAHWKRTAARKAEVDIFYETNPYVMRILVNTELMMKLNLKLSEKLSKISENKEISSEERDEIKRLYEEIKNFSEERKFRNKIVTDSEDWKYFKKQIK